jgi:hypothetical protein
MNTAAATAKIPHFIAVIKKIAKITVKIRFHLRSMSALSTARSSIAAALEKGRGRAERQISINIGIAVTHFCPKIIGT